jgi:hypothetical protein
MGLGPVVKRKPMHSSKSIVRLTTEQVPSRVGTKKDILSWIKEARVAKLYVNTLRGYPFLKTVDILLWQFGVARLLLSLYKRSTLVRGLRRYPYGSRLVSFTNSRDPSLISRLTILEAEETLISPPKIFPRQKADSVLPLELESSSPPVQINVVSDAWVYGGSNLVFTNNSVLCHDLYNFSKDFTSEELHGRHLYFKRAKLLFVILRDPIPLLIPKAAACLDACAHNYAHFLTEVLPRIELFCSQEEYANIPLIIDDQLHENILEAIATIVGSSRKVYLLPIGRAIRCETLLIVSATGYVPFDQRNSWIKSKRQGNFSAHALQQLKAIPALASTQSVKYLPPLERIYIQRESSVRKLVNAAEIEDILSQHGFALIDPGKLSFREQVSLFANAKVIIGPTGAAMANAIFCQPGTEVGILMATHKHMIYKYWPAMLTPLKINVSYLLGTIVGNQSRGIHGDFVVPESAISDFLAECGR